MKAFLARLCVCGRWSTPVSSVPNILRLDDDAADGDAAEIDAVIAALAADQAEARAVTLARDDRRWPSSARYRPIPSRNCVHDVLEPVGRDVDARRLASSKASGWPNWKVGREIAARRPAVWIASVIFGRQWPALTHQRPADAVQDLPAVRRGVVHVLGGHDHARRPS